MFDAVKGPVPWAAFLTIGVAATGAYLAREKVTHDAVNDARQRIAVLESRVESVKRIENYFDDMIKKALAAPTGRGQ